VKLARSEQEAIADSYRRTIDFQFRLLHNLAPRDPRYLEMTEEEMYLELLAHKRHHEEKQARARSEGDGTGNVTATDAAAFERGLAALAQGADMDEVLGIASEAGRRAHREHPELVNEQQPDIAAIEAQLAELLSPGM
jgi:hypothetical protein